MQWNNEQRLKFSRATVALFFIAGIALSFSLWINDRAFPLLPVFGTVFLSSIATWCVTIVLLAGLAILAFRNIRIAGIIALSCLLLLVLNDQNRLQAWVYLYALLIAAITMASNADKAIQYMRLILVAVYFWSGIHKLNPHFIDGVYFGILTEVFGIEPGKTQPLMAWGYLIGIIEALIGILLLIPRTRAKACWLAILTHAFILIYLSPLGINSNFIVFPWNAAMIVLVLLLFYKSNDRVMRFAALQELRILTVVIVAWLLPVLNFFGCWDHYLSFSYYSNKTSSYYVALSNTAKAAFHEKLHVYFMDDAPVDGGVFLNVNSWSTGELGVPFYPQTRTFRELQDWFCSQGIPPAELSFLEFPPDHNERVIITKCGDNAQ